MDHHPAYPPYDAAILDAELARRRAARRSAARNDADLLAQRGRLARLALRYREAAAFYGEAADLVGFDPVMAQTYRRDSALALTLAAEQETGA